MAASGERRDPLTTFLFYLKIETTGLPYSGGQALFRSIGGLNFETEMTPYQEGGITAFQRWVVGNRKWSNLTLKQGFSGDDKLWRWRHEPRRVDGSIYMMGPERKVACGWKFVSAYPVKWEGPELNAEKSELAIETIELAHHGLELDTSMDGKPAEADEA